MLPVSIIISNWAVVVWNIMTMLVYKYNSAPSYITKEAEYYTEVLKYYTIKVPEYSTTTYAAPAYYTDALKYYTEKAEYYTTAYAAQFTTPRNPSITLLQPIPNRGSGLFHHQVPEYYTTTYAAPSYYTEAPK
jgi:hypothetical protein